MQTDQVSHRSSEHEAAQHDRGDTVAARPAPTVGPLGGIVFSALCAGTYVAVVAALVVS